MIRYACPVLAVRHCFAELAAFDACYAVRANGLSVRFEQVQWPVLAGSLDQPARLTEALTWMALVANDELRKQQDDQQEHGTVQQPS